jgi:hypothetical protein
MPQRRSVDGLDQDGSLRTLCDACRNEPRAIQREAPATGPGLQIVSRRGDRGLGESRLTSNAWGIAGTHIDRVTILF